MNVKLFQTRLDSQFIHQDQETLNAFMDSVTVKKTSTQFVIGQPDFWSVLVFYENGRSSRGDAKEKEKISFEPDIELSEAEKPLFAALKMWRKDKAREANVPEYIVCHNAELVGVTKTRPGNIEELNRVKGFGAQKISKYGDDIIAVVNAF